MIALFKDSVRDNVDFVVFNNPAQVFQLFVRRRVHIRLHIYRPVTNVVLNGLTEGNNVIIKFNDTVRDNVDFVVLSNRAQRVKSQDPHNHQIVWQILHEF
jgi:hypothetical protein